jgi:hypothetical protein
MKQKNPRNSVSRKFGSFCTGRKSAKLAHLTLSKFFIERGRQLSFFSAHPPTTFYVCIFGHSMECTLFIAKPERFKLSVRAIDDFVSVALI